jgi:hypothetical protein
VITNTPALVCRLLRSRTGISCPVLRLDSAPNLAPRACSTSLPLSILNVISLH